ncbi:hypothetical protein CGCSCA4_v005973 [Colletotrichum siamense]|uniref:DUF7580 domain-containing protein n=1 Tax=Colletotrichum siamense TaxID=690259 RepID=A0A9P5BR19_COLSI|nr:hypothetical protein CGCSCA4_v005973 [Colletotrichum siamense]KAF4849371.1 hypothetical protein CGCSCA2_v011962 [Colletotrichum siamense]
MVAAWRDESLRQRIEDLLDSTFNVFKGTLEEIQKSVDELKTKLGIPNGQVHLGLESRSSSIAERGDKKSTQSLSFQLAVNYRAIDTIAESEGDSNDQLLWKRLLMQTLQSDITFATVPIRCQLDNNRAGQKTESLVKGPQQNSVQMRSYGGQTTTIQLPSSNYAPTRPTISLCKEIRAGPKSKDIACYGIIADSLAKSAEFQVFPQTDLDGEKCSTVSLHQILQARGNGLPYIFKLRLATKISSSFFQLHSTPWLPENLSSRQILFIKTGEFINFEQAFVMRSFPEADSGSTNPASRDHGAALRCLGLVLLELDFEETIESLRRTHNTTPRSIYSAEIDGMLKLYGDATIDRLIRSRNWVGNYGRVVNLCMNGHRGTIDLNDEELRQEIYESIVQPLEFDWNLSTFRTPEWNL